MQLVPMTDGLFAPTLQLISSLDLGRHLDEDFIRHLTFDDPTAPPEWLLLAVEEGQVLGFCFACARQGMGVVKLFGVRPDRRRQGIATALFDRIENLARAWELPQMVVEGVSPGYVLPGVDLACTPAIAFLTRRSYQTDRNTRVDMEVDLRQTSLDTSAAEARLAAEGLVLRQARPDDIAAAAGFALQFFGTAWQIEVGETARFDPPPLFIALDGGCIVGFAVHDVTGRGRFGPTGTRPDYRHRGIGGVLLKMCLRNMRARGDELAEIVWAGPLGFYARAVDARIHRAYWGFRKTLS